MKRASFIIAAALAIGQQAASAGDILGTANSFGVLAGSTVTNTGLTIVHGDVGVWPGSAVTGFPPGLLFGGSMHAGNSTAEQAQNDLTIAYNSLAGMASTQDLTGLDLGGLILTPGVYSFSSSAFLTSMLTLDAQGDPNAVFVFQMGSTLITASDSSVTMINGADDCQVFWQVGSSATLGTGTAFQGNIVALTSITMTTNATLNGRALALNGAVTMDSNIITPGCIVPAPATVMLLGPMLCGLIAPRRRPSRG